MAEKGPWVYFSNSSTNFLRRIFQTLDNLTAPGLYILEVTFYIKSNNHSNSNNHHNYCRKKPKNSRLKIFNDFPVEIRLTKSLSKIKTNLKDYLIQQSFYSLSEFTQFSKPRKSRNPTQTPTTYVNY